MSDAVPSKVPEEIQLNLDKQLPNKRLIKLLLEKFEAVKQSQSTKS
ncbi:hypothetical protein [Legionella saoudiensis]|nr:hypothetical protein [Legionella saoudiensis]